MRLDSLAPEEGPISISAAFTGRMSGYADLQFSTADARPRDAASRLKKTWLSKATIQPELQEAISALTAVFWSNSPVAENVPAGRVFARLPNVPVHDRLVQLDDVQGPSPLEFLIIVRNRDQSQRPTWQHIPTHLQEAVQDWFSLFCFELAQQGYHVRCQHEYVPGGSHVKDTYSIEILGVIG